MSNRNSDTESDSDDLEVLATRLPSSLHERVKQHIEDGEYANKSEAVRDLLRRGLEDTNRQPGIHFTVPAAAATAGFFLIGFAWGQAGDVMGYVGIALVAVGIAYHLSQQ